MQDMRILQEDESSEVSDRAVRSCGSSIDDGAIVRNSFVFYRGFYEAISDLDPVDRAAVYDAICMYALDGIEPETTGIVSAMFKMAKPQIDANNRKYKSGKQGGRPKKQQKATSEPDEKQKETKQKPEENQNVTTSEPDSNQSAKNENPMKNEECKCKCISKEKTKAKEKEAEFRASVVRIIDRLNEKAGTHYRYDTKSTVSAIRARLETYSIDDVLKVIDKKSAEWMGTDMEQYLNPDTLFRPGNFEKYLNQPESPPGRRKSGNGFKNFPERSDRTHQDLVQKIIAMNNG